MGAWSKRWKISSRKEGPGAREFLGGRTPWAQTAAAVLTVMCEQTPAHGRLESTAGVYSTAESQPLRPWSTDDYMQQPPSRTYIVGRLHKCQGTTNFPKAKWCIGVGNFNKFAGTLQLGKGCLKLVSRHKELFRKWLAFQATPKNAKILYIQWDPWNNNYLCFHCPEVWGSKQTNSHFPYLELVCCYFL